MRFLGKFASLRLTVVAMSALAGTMVCAQLNEEVDYSWITLPIAVLLVNLLAALFTNVRLRREPALVLFHLALVAVCVLAALDAATRFHGRVELVEGQSLDSGQVQTTDRGVWHRSRLDETALRQDTIEVEFAPNMNRQRTRSKVSFVDDGMEKRDELGESRALELRGYRFATTSNKGYAMVLTWRDAEGREATGAIHFPSYPAQEWRQQQTWRTPAGQQVTLSLRPHTRPRMDSEWILSANASAVDAEIVIEGVSAPLVRGEWQALRDGAVRLDDVRLWMGYRVDYQPLIPWMFVVSLLGVAALAWYFHARLWRSQARHDVSRSHRKRERLVRV